MDLEPHWRICGAVTGWHRYLLGFMSQSWSTIVIQVGNKRLGYKQAKVGVPLPKMNWGTVSYERTGAGSVCLGKTWEGGH